MEGHSRIQKGTKPFELQVSTGELVNDLRGYITDREDCCHRTCFSLQYNGIPMDHFAELRSVEGLKDHSVFKVVEEPYTTREARLHIRHVRDLIKSLDTSDAMNGLNGASISYLNTITEGEIDPNSENDLKEPSYIQYNAGMYINIIVSLENMTFTVLYTSQRTSIRSPFSYKE